MRGSIDMSHLDLSIVIVSFNTRELTLACMESIFTNVKGISFEVIVVDNASEDDSVEGIKPYESRVKNKNFKLIENKENVGFSKANNIGVKHSSGRYVLFLNSDTVVPEGTLERMVSFMDEHPKVGAGTCFVRMGNGKLDDAAHRGFPTPWNSFTHFSGLGKIFPHSLFFNGYHLGYKNLDTVHEIDALAGAFMIVRRVAGEEIGWWDEEYFFYGEDIDFCYKLKEKGWKIYFVPDVEILHHKGASGGIKKESAEISKASLETRRWATNQRFNAMKSFYKKHYTKKYPWVLTWVALKVIDLKKTLALRQYQ